MGTIEIVCTAIGTVIAIIGGVYGVINYIFNKGMNREHLVNFENSTKEGFSQINKRLDNQNSETKNSISKLESKIDKVCDTVIEHTTALVEIYAILGHKYPKKRESFLQKNSPHKLTELGQKICNEVQGEKFLNNNKATLFEYIDEHKPLTRLDVEELSVQALFRQTSKPVFNYIKDYVYEAPAYKDINGEMSELTIGDICFILSIPLRDMYLKERDFK